MPKRKRKKYSRPRKPFDKLRIEEEDLLVEKYGLKNKREIWKADAEISRIRNLGKKLITRSEQEKRLFIERLQKQGFKVESIPDSLALDKEDWLKRRLQTIVYSKGLTSTPKQARQLINHKHVSIGDQITNIPSYQVSLEEEPEVKLNIVLKVKKPEKERSKEKEVKTEESEEEFKIDDDIEKELEETITINKPNKK